MAIILPNLDDRSYEELRKEGMALIQRYAPDEWTNHNPSDPGITLVELFAYLTEMLMYRANRVTAQHRRVFARVFESQRRGKRHRPSDDQAIRTVTAEWGHRIDRAITCQDFEALAKSADAKVARAICVGGYDLDVRRPVQTSGHMSVMIIPVLPPDDERNPRPDDALLRRVKRFLEHRRLLTTHVHVVEPRYVPIRMSVTLSAKPRIPHAELRTDVVKALRRFLHAVHGGSDGTGWPHGRGLHLSDLYACLHGIQGVASAEFAMEIAPERLRFNDRREIVSVDLRPGELPDAQIDETNIHVQA